MSIAIANFEVAESWTITNGSFDSTYTKQGSNAIKLTSTGFNWDANCNYYPPGGLNLSAFADPNNNMSIWVYVDDATKISGVQLTLENTGGVDRFIKSQQTGGWWQNGWNEVTFLATDFSTEGNPSWSTSIAWIKVALAASGAVTVNAWLDWWRIITTGGFVTTNSKNW